MIHWNQFVCKTVLSKKLNCQLPHILIFWWPAQSWHCSILSMAYVLGFVPPLTIPDSLWVSRVILKKFMAVFQMYILPGNSQNILILHICPLLSPRQHLMVKNNLALLESSSIASLTSHLPPFGDSLIVVWISIVLALLPMISTYSVHQNDSIWNVDRIDARDAWLYANPNTSLLMPADMVKIAHIKNIAA